MCGVVWCGVGGGGGGGHLQNSQIWVGFNFYDYTSFFVSRRSILFFLHTRFFCRLVGFPLIYGENLHVLMKELQLKWLANDTLTAAFFESCQIKIQSVACTTNDRSDISQGTDGFGSRRSVHHRLKRNDKGEWYHMTWAHSSGGMGGRRGGGRGGDLP